MEENKYEARERERREIGKGKRGKGEERGEGRGDRKGKKGGESCY